MQTATNKWNCPWCELEAKTRSGLRDHIRSQHAVAIMSRMSEQLKKFKARQMVPK